MSSATDTAPLPEGGGRTVNDVKLKRHGAVDDVCRSSAATTIKIIKGRRRRLGGAPTLKDVNDGEKNSPRSGAV